MGVRRNVTIDAARLRNAIRQSGRTQKEIAIKLGLNDAYISTSLTQGSINGSVLGKIAAYLGCYPEDFILADGHAAEFIGDVDRICNLLAAIYKKLSVIDSNVVSLGKSLREEESEPTDEVDQLVKKLFGGAA